MSREDPKVNIRLPADLKEQLHALAAENKRSVNAEVVAAIEKAVALHNRHKSLIDSDLEQNPHSYLTSEELITKIAELLSKNGI